MWQWAHEQRYDVTADVTTDAETNSSDKYADNDWHW